MMITRIYCQDILPGYIARIYCQDIQDTSAFDPTQKNLLLLDNCFLGRQNKAESILH